MRVISDRPMRILWLNHRDTTHPRAGGAERTIVELSKRFHDMGNEITLLTSGYGNFRHEESTDFMSIYRFRGNISPHLVSSSFLHRDYDVVIDDLAHAVPWFSEWLGHVPGLVFFRHLHARSLSGQVPMPMEIAIRLIEREYHLIYRKWPFVTESETGVKDLQGLRIRGDRIYRIPPGVDTTKFRPVPKTLFPSIVFTGRFMAYKRPDHAIEAMKIVNKSSPEAKLTMIGEGPLLEEMKMLAAKNGLADVIQFTGKVTDDRMAYLVGSAWVNLHTSTTEGWGYSIMEASACGVPTVGYRVPGVAESVQDKMNGSLVRDGNIESLARGILSVIGEPGRMRVSSREYAEGFSWRKTAEKWDALLRFVIHRDGEDRSNGLRPT